MTSAATAVIVTLWNCLESGWVTAAIIVGLVSELGSLATYAGLLTAGLAVALQNVIVSIVASSRPLVTSMRMSSRC